MNSFHLTFALVGESGVGKSTFVNKHSTGEFTSKYCPSIFGDLTHIAYNTPLGYVNVKVKEYTTTSTIQTLESFSDDLDGVMVMFDQTRPDTLWNSLGVIDRIQESYPGLPIVLVGGKADVRKRKFYHDDIVSEAREIGVKYDDVSSYTNKNIEMPILRLVREGLGQPELKFISLPAIAPPTINVSDLDLDRIWANIEQANSTPLPDVEDNSVDLLEELTNDEKEEMNVQPIRNVSMLHHFHATLGRIQPRAKL